MKKFHIELTVVGGDPNSMEFDIFGPTDLKNGNIFWFGDPSWSDKKVRKIGKLAWFTHGRSWHVKASTNYLFELQMSWGVDWYPYCHIEFLIYFFYNSQVKTSVHSQWWISDKSHNKKRVIRYPNIKSQ